MQLKLMATEMRSRLQGVQRGWVQRNLFGGLSLVLERRDAQWRLALARPNTLPSTVEERVAGAAFGVPAGTEWRRGARKDKNEKRFWVTECRWLEVADDSEKEGADVVGTGTALESGGTADCGTPDADGAGVVRTGANENDSQRDGGHPA